MARGNRGPGNAGGTRRGSARVRGKVVRVVADKGFCFVEPGDLPAGFELEQGKGIFMHKAANNGRLPAQGDSGEFEIEQGDKGLKVTRVVRWLRSAASGATASRQQQSNSPTFIHPYNFVPVPADGLGQAADVEPFVRRAPSWHDRYDPELFSGWLQCSLTTKSWWFIPDARKQASQGDHKVLGYFTLDEVDEDAWDGEHPETDRTCPAIPASSLRGMVRSVFEAATLSCLRVFDESALDFRIGFDPGVVSRGVRIPSGRNPSYVPARIIERRADGSVTLQRLEGRRREEATATPAVLPVALVHAFDPKVRVGTPPRDRAGTATPLWSTLNLGDGSPVAAVISSTPTTHRSGRYQYREAASVVPADQAATLSPRNGQWLIFGYLHRTGPNIENKHHERIFFRADAPYNAPGSREPVAARLAAFKQDQSPALVASADVVRAADASLRGYAERLRRDLRHAPAPPRSIGANAPYPSDFVTSPPKTLRAGDLCYALVEGNCVRGLYPVALPRLTHEDSRGALLHPDFHPCCPDGKDLCLCPACRVFGWVRPGEGGLTPQAGRIDAVAGHVRFTHGTLDGPWGTGDRQARLATLAILGSPKPTTTAFYLRPRKDFQQARSERWPPVLQTALHENIPLYRRDEASLRGRKFYRHRQEVNAESHDPAAGGILRPPGNDGEPVRDSQNQTVHLLPPELKLGFRVYFDNLTSEELGALVFATTLLPPTSWGTSSELRSELRHALGHGKPLGLGACRVEIEAWQIDVLDPNNPKHRYAQVPSFDTEPGVQGRQPGAGVAAHIEAFGRAFAEAERRAPELQRLRESLVEMLRADPPDGPVQYPPDPEGDVAKNYEWFVHNRRARASRDQPKGTGVLLPDPVDERVSANRLPRDPRESQQ